LKFSSWNYTGEPNRGWLVKQATKDTSQGHSESKVEWVAGASQSLRPEFSRKSHRNRGIEDSAPTTQFHTSNGPETPPREIARRCILCENPLGNAVVPQMVR
jgi:hypothetical protein